MSDMKIILINFLLSSFLYFFIFKVRDANNKVTNQHANLEGNKSLIIFNEWG